VHNNKGCLKFAEFLDDFEDHKIKIFLDVGKLQDYILEIVFYFIGISHQNYQITFEREHNLKQILLFKRGLRKIISARMKVKKFFYKKNVFFFLFDFILEAAQSP